MKSSSQSSPTAQAKSSSESSPAITVRDERFFFIIVTAVLGFIYFVSVREMASLREPLRLAAYTTVMLLYAALFWLPVFRSIARPQVYLYLFAQAALAFVLMMMVGQAALAFGIIAPLIGMTMGMIPSRTTAALAIVALLALSAFAVFLTAGWSELGVWPALVLPLTIFIVVYVVLYDRQAEAREQAQALATELEIANAGLASYAAQVEELTLAAERQRMARELHDTLAQGVAGLILQLEAVNARLETGETERAQTIVQQAMARARSTLADARRAIDDLRAGEHAACDLSTEIRAKTTRFSTTTGIPCHLDLALPMGLTDAVINCVVSAVDEGLANIAKHAQASEIWVRADVEGSELLIEIRDNGIGFDTDLPVPIGHYGLLGLRERAQLAGGSVNIASASGQGTALQVRLPISQKTHD